MFLPWRKGRNIGGYSYLCPFNFDVDFMMYSRKEIWQLAQNVINVTDTAFLGHVGEVALGASAMGGLLYICIYTVAFGFSIGSQILIARRNGEQNYRNVGPARFCFQSDDGGGIAGVDVCICPPVDSGVDFIGCYL